MSNSAILVEKSSNKKTGKIAVTWTNEKTCPKECPFLTKCYPNYGPSNFVVKRLNSSEDTDVTKIAKKEAELIDGCNVNTPLRLKVYGDCPTRKSAQIVAKAAKRFQIRNQQPVYGYTHAWRTVKSEDWEDISVLASCETPDEVTECKKNGWGTVITMEKFPSKNMFDYHGIKVIPCPNQTRNVQCVDCKLCMRADLLKKNDYSIGFSAHGTGGKYIREVIKEKMETYLENKTKSKNKS